MKFGLCQCCGGVATQTCNRCHGTVCVKCNAPQGCLVCRGLKQIK